MSKLWILDKLYSLVLEKTKKLSLIPHNSISPALNYTVYPGSSIYSQISQLVRFFSSKTVLYLHKKPTMQT